MVLLVLQRDGVLLLRILRVVVWFLLLPEGLEGSRGAMSRRCISSLFPLHRGRVCCAYWWRSVLSFLGQECTKRLRFLRL